MIDPPFVALLNRAESDIREQRRDNTTLRRSVVRAQELILRQDTGFQEPSDQSDHLPVDHTLAQSIEEMMMAQIVETALDVTFYNPAVWQPAPMPVLVSLTRLDGKANTLQGAVDAPPGSKPVGDIPELRLEDRLQEQFDRALDDAIFDCGNAQGSELSWFPGLGDELAS